MKKKIIIKLGFIITSIIVLISLSTTVVGKFSNKKSCEDSYLEFANKNEKTVFSINKCVFFCNCNVKNKTSSNTNFTIENLYQYVDIALFINNNSDEYTPENTLKSVKINNLQYVITPSCGNQKICYKNINSFAESMIIDSNIFDDELAFDISSDSNADLNNPILYNNCANPIVLSYINENIKNDYTLTDTGSPITYDSSLLKKCGVLLSSLNVKFSFDIYITNNLNQEFKCTVYIEPPIESSSTSLYDGALTVTQNTNYNFYRYK